MRKPSTLDALLTATRQGILAATLMSPDRWWYLSDLARHLRVHHATLQRDLGRLGRAGILLVRRDGNRVYYRANPDSPVFPELRALLIKTVGLADVLREALRPFAARIRTAFVFGSVARATETAESDIDLLVIGDVTLRGISPAIRGAERTLGRPLNPLLYRPDEFAHKLASRDHLLVAITEGEKLYVVGGPHDLDRLAPGGPTRTPQGGARRNRRAEAGS
jgi:predicted nucleotidyltransferase